MRHDKIVADDERPARPFYIRVSQWFDLNHACIALTEAFGYHTYLVGSACRRPDYRDVDLRCILPDAQFDRFTGGNPARLALLNAALSEWLAARTGLPIDFQFQRRTEANAEYGGPEHTRNFIGMPASDHRDAAPLPDTVE